MVSYEDAAKRLPWLVTLPGLGPVVSILLSGICGTVVALLFKKLNIDPAVVAYYGLGTADQCAASVKKPPLSGENSRKRRFCRVYW